jgi:hypothetical protein
MKTNPIARRIIKLHVVLLWVSIAAIAVLEFGMGQTLANHIGQACGGQTVGSMFGAPNTGLADLMAAAR